MQVPFWGIVAYWTMYKGVVRRGVQLKQIKTAKIKCLSMKLVEVG